MTPKEVADYLIANRRALRTRRGRKCPVCGSTGGWCLRMEDESAALCPKSNGTGSVQKYGEYGYLYLLGSGLLNADAATLPRVEKRRDRTDKELHALWAPRARHWWKGQEAQVGKLAAVLGVASWALDELLCGWDGKAWTFPERNADGLIIGVNRRFEDGGKRCATGSRRGLTYSETWADNPGPVLLVEGQSDAATGITLGVAVIGRPSNTGGVAMLGKLLGRHPERRVVVMGERDRKADGRAPGVDGGRSVCQALTRRLGSRVGVRLPPDGAKDLR